MRRPDTSIDPAVQRELDALEAALRGEPGADPALRALTEDVRGLRAEPSQAFRARLDARAAEGFPRARRLPHWRLGLTPAVGAAAAMLIGLTAVGLTAGGGGSGGRVSEEVEPAAPGPQPAPLIEPAGGGGSVADDSTTSSRATPPGPTAVTPVPPPPNVDVVPGQRARKVERSAELHLSAPRDDVATVSDRIVRATQALGGVVARSQVNSGGDGGSATFTLRVPEDALDDALARLSRLAHVSALTQDSTDITGPVDSTADRLSDARAHRRALLRALGRAGTQSRIESLRRRLRLAGSQISRLKGDLEALRRRAGNATILVTVSGDGEAGENDGAGNWTPGDAVTDALRVLEVAAGVLIVAAAALLPLLALALPAAFAARALRRRRREQALEGA